MTTWNGHVLVSSGHPEDDDPWCTNCGIPANHEDARQPCTKQPRCLTCNTPLTGDDPVVTTLGPRCRRHF